MKETIKKAVSLALGTTMVMSLAACGGAESSSVAESESQTSTAASSTAEASAPLDYASIEKPESISWCSHDGMLPENGQEQWDAEYERLTGIKLEHTYVTGNEYNSKIEMDYAADTVPDVFDLSSTYYSKYIAEGAIADLTDLVHESGLYELVDEKLWEQVSYKGRIYGIPKEVPQACGTYMRKDWLDRLGLEVPTTYDEFINVLEQFKENIPECQVPYTAPGLVTSMYIPDFYQGAYCGFEKIDGKWVDGMQQPEMVTALQNMQDAYKEGLLDMEAITNTTATARDAWNSGHTGAFCYWTGNWGQQLTEQLQKNVPDAEVICIPAIQGADYLSSTPTVHVINGRLSDEKIAQVFKYFINYMHDGGEGQVLFEFGVEGVHWTQDDDHVKMLPSLSDPNVTLNKAYILPSSRITDLTLNDKKMDYAPAYTDSLAVTDACAKEQYFQPVSATYNSVSADLTTLLENTVAEIVTGNVSVEDGLQSYKDQAAALNMDQILTEMNS